VDECTVSANCVHGTCSNTDGGYTCTCENGYTGTQCDTDVNRADGSTATSSNPEGDGDPPSNLVDGDNSTTFTLTYSNDTWVMIDLGEEIAVNHVEICSPPPGTDIDVEIYIENSDTPTYEETLCAEFS
ncbi:unnamed protein product, partial [Owenia fusiformis]